MKTPMFPSVSQAEFKSCRFDRPTADIGIIVIQHGEITGALPAEDRLFRRTIMLQIRMPVEMVRREICHHCDMRTDLKSIKIHQLKTA